MNTFTARLTGLCLMVLVGFAAAPGMAERRAVLDQIDLPHPYYFREMYLPQITQGPSGMSWSPDSRELIYSMGGALWRQRLDSGRAVQLTDGAGFDYQPDWSPDGRQVIYSSYQSGAIELWLLDLDTRQSTQLTRGGAVNVEPRFSPDGRRIVYVSTAGTGHFHAFIADLADGALANAMPLRGDVKSSVRRYYYSAFDHEINPTWSRDGKDILFVSNHEHAHGTGGFWRVAATPGAAPHEIHYEETNWRARPEFSPDGALLLYSSYLGRNSHQLWLLPAQGGDPMPLTYGEADATAARWSPDARHVAYVSNQNGDLELRVLDYPGHDSRALATAERETLRPMVDLVIRTVDGRGQLLPARVSVNDSHGRPYAPPGAWIHADDSYDRHDETREGHYFHSTGEALLSVPSEQLAITISHGLETPLVRRTVTPLLGTRMRLTIELHAEPFVTDAATRWVSGDAHVHMNYAGTYRNTPERLAQQARAEGLSIVNALVVNKEQRFPDLAYAGPAGDFSAPDVLVVHGQEYHTSFWGHLGILHPDGGILLPGYVGYPNTAAASLSPMNADIADLAHAQGALAGYVHPFEAVPEPLARPREALSSELPVDVALGKVDYIEILGFSDHRSTASVWYRLLNLGFHLPAAAGTDAMADYASLRGPVGLNRVYVQVPTGPLNIGDWLDGLRAGHTFATNGPLLEFELAANGPGAELKLKSANSAVPFHARLRSIVPVEHLEVVCNGKVVKDLLNGKARGDADLKGTLDLRQSGWCVLRAGSAGTAYPVLDNYLYGTTSPVYVRIGNEPVKSPEDARYFVAWIDRVYELTSAYPDWRSPVQKADVLSRLREAQEKYRLLE
ncbi:MAG: CehA/McbA family metallohydrolase [Steroidobacterales bacterium]